MRIAVSCLLLLATLATESFAQQRHDPLNPRDRREADRDRADRDDARRDREERERREREFDRDFGRRPGGGGGFGHRPGPGRWRRPDGRLDGRSRRRDQWADMEYRRRKMRLVEDRALLGEPNAILIGYTLLSEGEIDFDAVEVMNPRGPRSGKGYDDIKIKVLGDNATVAQVNLAYCDRGEWGLDPSTQSFSINKRLMENSSTDWINLKGKNRCIRKFGISGKGDRFDDDDTVVVILGRNRWGN